MSLKLRRLVRTPTSEQFALYAAQGDKSTSVGKLDLHFTSDGVFGTLLLWDEDMIAWEEDALAEFVEGLVEDLLEPYGMPEQYAIEYFVPVLDSYRFFTNMDVDE